jgi:biotin synthase-like enzyme
MRLTGGSTGRSCEWQRARQRTCNDNFDLHLEPQSEQQRTLSARTTKLIRHQCTALRRALGLDWECYCRENCAFCPLRRLSTSRSKETQNLGR